MRLIHELCKWGQGQFDGWVIPKAVYTQFLQEPFHNCPDHPSGRFQVQAAARPGGFVLAEAVEYTQAGAAARCLEVTLLKRRETVRTRVQTASPSYTAARPGESAAQRTHAAGGSRVLCFTHSGLQQFLEESGDTNPIHQGDPALVPGLWIFNRLYQDYPRKHWPAEYKLRLYHPTFTGQAVFLDGDTQGVRGVCHGNTHFHMQVKHL